MAAASNKPTAAERFLARQKDRQQVKKRGRPPGRPPAPLPAGTPAAAARAPDPAELARRQAEQARQREEVEKEREAKRLAAEAEKQRQLEQRQRQIAEVQQQVGAPTDDPLEGASRLCRMLLVQADQVFADTTLDGKTARSELRAIARSVNSLIPKARMLQAEQAVRGAAALMQRPRADATLSSVPDGAPAPLQVEPRRE